MGGEDNGLSLRRLAQRLEALTERLGGWSARMGG